MGFFNGKSIHSSKAPAPRVAQCGACRLYQTCSSPKMPVAGDGKRGILLVGEFPGKQEDEAGSYYVGESARFLQEEFAKIDNTFDLMRDTWRTNALICRPEKSRKPTDKEVDYCRPNLLQTIERLRPRVVFMVGASALRSVIGHCWKESPGSINRWAGFAVPYHKWDSWLLATYSPAYVLRDGRSVGSALWFFNHLKKLLALDGRPSDHVPDYTKHVVRKLYDTEEIRRVLSRVVESGELVSFDYETNKLKPDSTDAEVVSCALTWNGKRTYAFPIYPQIMEDMRVFLRSFVPKVGANIKFEDRWSRAFFGTPVNGWKWDTMQAAHVLDNRSEISSVKFQSFVLLGADLYNQDVESYLTSSFPNESNRIRELPIDTLLQYNGLDAWYEFHIAVKQMELFRAG